MNEQDLKHILARNPAITATDHSGHPDSGTKRDTPRSQVHDTIPKPDQRSALERVEERKEKSQGRVSVRFIGFRTRLLDPDNFAGSVKDLLDCLRQSHIIYDDSPDFIDLHTTQVKVATRKEERTEIVITPA